MSRTPIALVVAMDIALVVAHLANAGLAPGADSRSRLFDLGVEANVPTWWASTKLALSAVLLGAAARRRGRGLAAAAVLVGLMSIDETAMIHERVASATLTDSLPITGYWPFIFGSAALVSTTAIAWGSRATWSSDRRAAGLLFGGVIGVVAFAAGVELAVNVVDGDVALELAQVTVEEAGELAAGTAIMAGAYRYSARGSEGRTPGTSVTAAPRIRSCGRP